MEAALQVALQAALVLQPPELLLVVPLVARLIAPTVSLLVLLALLPLVCLVLDLQGWLQALDLCAHDRVDPGLMRQRTVIEKNISSNAENPACTGIPAHGSLLRGLAECTCPKKGLKKEAKGPFHNTRFREASFKWFLASFLPLSFTIKAHLAFLFRGQTCIQAVLLCSSTCCMDRLGRSLSL